MVLDGGLATLLERHGHDLTSGRWSARLLHDDPDAVQAAHAEYFSAGAQVATTASYQASFEGFAAAGLSTRDTTRLLRRSCEVADAARRAFERPHGSRAWVAASVGPYGAMLADGSEYLGDYGLTVAELRRWHRPRLQVLMQAVTDGLADVLAVETIPCAVEAEAVLAELDGSGVPAWLSLTCAGGRTRAGEPAADVFALARGVAEVIAVGVNCCDAAEAEDLVGDAVAASGLPGVVYPNSGEDWDAGRRRWAGDPTFTADAVTGWREAGARLVGGCCRVGPPQVAAISAAVAVRSGR